MKAIIVLAICCMVLSGSAAFNLRRLPAEQKQTDAVDMDLCPVCVNFMAQEINVLLNIILNADVVGGCADLCSYLDNQLEQVVCDLLCDYVGITEFINLIEWEDPDPIYICQEMDICPWVPGGKANITNTYITPNPVSVNDMFNITMEYTIFSATSTGILFVVIQGPDGGELSGEEFTEGQPPGRYSLTWEAQAVPSEQESFQPGVYQVQVGICAGDCTTNHPYGGVYALYNTKFTVTQ